MKPVSQFPVLKGLIASNQVLAQPKGSVARISNFTYIRRGALNTCDGSLILNWYNGAIQTSRGQMENFALFQPTNISRYFLVLARAIGMQLSSPLGLAAANGGAGGSLPAGTYYYVVTAIDGVGGETPASAEVSITTGGVDLVNLTWTAVPNAAGYNVYRGTSPGAESLLSGTGLPDTINSYTDNGSAANAGTITYNLLASPNGAIRQFLGGGGSLKSYLYTFTTTGPNAIRIGQGITVAGVAPSDLNGTYSGPAAVSSKSGNSVSCNAHTSLTLPNENGGGGTLTIASASPPIVNTTQIIVLYKMPSVGTYPISYSDSNIVATFPASVYPQIGGLPGGLTSAGGTNNAPPTPNGGVIGNTAPLPQMVQFLNQEILALGNGYAPQLFSDPNTVTAITNTFIPAYPTWAASSLYAVNSIVQPTTPNGFYYVAIQGGDSGATDHTATWPTGTGQQVADGSVIWQVVGPVQGSAPAPPGAAHAIVYAGSLWVGNTWPVDHADGIDGPSALRMSDVNNPNSWDPINAAFLDKDDGTQLQGMATFTIEAQGIPPEGSLVVFKDFATYQIVGVFGASNFLIQRVRTDLGCIASRSIQFLPGFGIVRLTHLGVAIFDGVNDRVISEEIRPYLFMSNDLDSEDISPMDQNYAYASFGFQTANPPMYCLAIPTGNSGGQLTRILCYDLVMKVWTIVDLPFSISCAAQVRAPGVAPTAMFGGFLDGVLQRWQAGDTNWYTGSSSSSPVNWSFRTQTLASQDADQRLYARRIALRFDNNSSTAGIKFIVSVNGVPQQPFTSLPLGVGTHTEVFAPVLAIGVKFEADISGSGDVSLESIGWHVVSKSAGVPVVIA